MTDAALDGLTDEQLREEAYRAELRANLARNEIQRPGAARDRVLATIDQIPVDPDVNLDELKRALTTGGLVAGPFAAAAEAFARVAGRRLLADTLREWATTVPLEVDPAAAEFGGIRWDTTGDRDSHLARLQATVHENDERVEQARRLLDRREQDRREQEIEERARGIRERSTL